MQRTLRIPFQHSLFTTLNIFFHSLLSGCSVTANGMRNSSSKCRYGRKVFIANVFSHNEKAKETWLRCQDTSHENQSNDFTTKTL